MKNISIEYVLQNTQMALCIDGKVKAVLDFAALKVH